MLGHIADDLRDTQERINWCLDRDEKGNVESGTRSPWNSAFDRMEQSGRNHDLDDEDGHGYTFVKENKEAAAARIADPIHSQTVGIVGTCQETFRESQGDFHKLPSAIEKAIAAAGANVRLQPVLFSEIHRACIIVDHNIYVWNYVQDEVRRQHASHTRPMRVARFICPHASRHVPHAFSDASRRPASMGVCVSHAPLTPHASLITFDITCLSSRDVTQIAAAERGRALRNGDAHWQTGGQKCRVTLANCRDGKLNGGKKTVDQCRAPPHEPHHTRNTSAGRWRD